MSGRATTEDGFENLFQVVVETAYEGICTLDAVGVITYANTRVATMLGRSVADLIGRPVFDFMAPQAAFEARTRFAMRQRGIPDVAEVAFVLPDGGMLAALESASSTFDGDGRFTGAVCLFTDITGRAIAEQRLRESERYFRALTESSSELVSVIDAEGVLRYANGRFLRVLGWSSEEALGRSVFDFVAPEDRERLEPVFRELVTNPGHVVVADHGVVCRNGETRALNAVGRNLLDDPAVRGIVVNASDVTERRFAEDALRKSETRFEHVVASVPGMVYQYAINPDWSGGYTYVSEGARQLFGVDPAAAVRDASLLVDLIHPGDRDGFRAAWMTAAAHLTPFRWDGRVLLPNGRQRFIQIVAQAERQTDGRILSNGIVTDVTALRELEQQLQQSQKMEAVGRLAGGIAHDFNNLLTVISGYTQIALQNVLPGSKLQADLGEVAKAAEGAAPRTQRQLAVSRPPGGKPVQLDVTETVTEVARMLVPIVGEDVRIETELAPNLWSVYADPGQIVQVLMNLAVNARDAMSRGGTIRLRTANVPMGGAAFNESAEMPVCDYVSIVVEDTGTGIDPEVLPHIFEPFYTTKPHGQGTGLGLSTVYGIVRQSGGNVTVESRLGEGSRFTVLLPRSAESHELSPTLPARGPKRGTETILLVEDEAAVRSAVEGMLTGLGYRVLEADSSESALAITAAADARGIPIHLVLTDVVMPDQTGRVLGERLTAFWPEIRILYMSGYTDDEILRRGLTHPGAAFLEKPFTIERLSEAVRGALA